MFLSFFPYYNLRCFRRIESLPGAAECLLLVCVVLPHDGPSEVAVPAVRGVEAAVAQVDVGAALRRSE